MNNDKVIRNRNQPDQKTDQGDDATGANKLGNDKAFSEEDPVLFKDKKDKA